MKKPAWSHSSLKDYEGCARRYHAVKILKLYPFQETQATRYGTQLHLAAEEYIRDDKPLPPEFEFIQTTLDALKAKPGRKLAEQKMALDEKLNPVGWLDKTVWVRGIADLLILDDDNLTAWVVDYKTGKNSRFADTKQLEILTLALFKHFPKVKRVKAGLLFVVAKDFVKAEYSQDSQDQAWVSWLNDTNRLEEAYKTEVWNPKPNFSCKNYCAVVSCVHNGKYH